jgi:hypothetical protein
VLYVLSKRHPLQIRRSVVTLITVLVIYVVVLLGSTIRHKVFSYEAMYEDALGLAESDAMVTIIVSVAF